MDIQHFETTFKKEFAGLIKSLACLDRLLVACSNGPDSKVLLHLLLNCAKQFKVKISVLHVWHNLRPVAWTEYQSLAAEVGELGIELLAWRADVPLYAKRNGLSSEMAASQLRRYAYALASAYYKQRGEKVAVCLAQHLDDQAETVLLHLLNGSNINGLGGIRPQRSYNLPGQEILSALDSHCLELSAVPLHFNLDSLELFFQAEKDLSYLALRPLLPYTKADLLGYATARQVKYFLDQSNLDTVYQRNFLRQAILPELMLQFPAAKMKLAALAKQMQEMAQFQHFLLTPYYKTCFQNLTADFSAWQNKYPTLDGKVVTSSCAFALTTGFKELQQDLTERLGSAAANSMLKLLLTNYLTELFSKKLPSLQLKLTKLEQLAGLLLKAALQPSKEVKCLALAKEQLCLILDSSCVCLNLSNLTEKLSKSSYNVNLYRQYAWAFWYSYYGSKLPLKANYQTYFKLHTSPKGNLLLRTATANDYLLKVKGEQSKKLPLYDYVKHLPLPLELYEELFVLAAKDSNHVQHLFYKNLTKDGIFERLSGDA